MDVLHRRVRLSWLKLEDFLCAYIPNQKSESTGGSSSRDRALDLWD